MQMLQFAYLDLVLLRNFCLYMQCSEMAIYVLYSLISLLCSMVFPVSSLHFICLNNPLATFGKKDSTLISCQLSVPYRPMHKAKK